MIVTDIPVGENPRTGRTPYHRADVRVIAFDVDGTLTAPAAPIDRRMAAVLSSLLDELDVCVISGNGFDQLCSQIVERLDAGPERLARLHLMPVNGTRYHRWLNGGWTRVYADDFPAGDSRKIAEVLIEAAKELGLWPSHIEGEVIADSGSQITYFALGDQASPEARLAWDPDNTKQERIRALAAERLPEQEVRSGGATAVDVTAKGVNKGHGVRRLIEQLGLRETNVLFVGDRLDVHGNDRPVKTLGVECVAVSRWQETAEFMEAWVGLPG